MSIYREWAQWNRWLKTLIRVGVLIATVGAVRGHFIPVNAYYAAVALVLVDTYLTRPAREGRSFADAGFGRARALPDLSFGFLVGALTMSAVVGVFALAGWYHVSGLARGPSTVRHFGVALVLYFFVGVTEEVLMRGLLWRLLEPRFGTWVALGGTSLVFGFGHLPNPHATIWDAFAIALEAGLLLGGLLVVTRTLWAPIGAHFAWNLFEGPVFGTSVSGLHEHPVLRAVLKGPASWTGGAFGPEGGLVAVMIGTFVAIALLVRARKRLTIYPLRFVLRTKRATEALPEGS